MDQPAQPLNFDTCALEPIHIPGVIQPFGVMLAGDLDLAQITHCSANIEDILGKSARETLNSSFADVLPAPAITAIKLQLQSPTARSQRVRVGVFEINDADVEIFAHVGADDNAVIECETLDQLSLETAPAAVDEIYKLLAAAGRASTIKELLATCAEGLRDTLGFDRVMGYRYEENGDGEVIAETRRPDLESFLGLRYPASDVPEQARAIQIRTPMRMLINLPQEPVTLLGRDANTKPLDMSLTHLRGVSPIHVEYMANMGVLGSLTISLIVEGSLWGMFACHHYSPRIVSADTRIAAEVFGQMVSLIIKQKLDVETLERRHRAIKVRESILETSENIEDVLNSFLASAPQLAQVMQSDGLALTYGEIVMTFGDTPDPAIIRALHHYQPDLGNWVHGIESLSRARFDHPTDAGHAAGALIVRATGTEQAQLTYFRNEHIRQLNWAGNPQKATQDGARMSPRQSFASYLEERRSCCEAWAASDLAAAREYQTFLTQIAAKGERAVRLRNEELVSQKRRQDLVIFELNHRVKNILALIKSLTRQAKSSSDSLETYVFSLEKRISALSIAHDLALNNALTGVSLRALVETELAPYLEADSGQVIISGASVGLEPDVAPMVALLLHEVSTNAAKYGALSVVDGIVQIKWTIEGDTLTFKWREIGGPHVAQTDHKGFGRSLIEQAVPFEIDGKVTYDFKPTGVELSLRIPTGKLVEIDVDAALESQASLAAPVQKSEHAAAGKHVLLAEDNAILAMDMVDSLTKLGALRVETAASYDAGVALAATTNADFAVLDMNLRGTVSFGIADVLAQRGIPYIFVTGYGTSLELPDAHIDACVLTKPVNENLLSQTIEQLFAETARLD